MAFQSVWTGGSAASVRSLPEVCRHFSTVDPQCISGRRPVCLDTRPFCFQRDSAMIGHHKWAFRRAVVKAGAFQPLLCDQHRLPLQQAQLPHQQVQPIGSNKPARWAVAASARLADVRQQLEQRQRPFTPALDTVSRSKQLTANIGQQQHWVQLQRLWLDNADEYGPFELTATLCRLARIVAKNGVAAADRPELFRFSAAILSAVHLCLEAMDARGAAQCLWAYAKLQASARHRCASGDAAADALAAALLLQGHIRQLAPSQLSQAAWAAAVLQPLGLTLPAGWWQAIQAQLLVRLPQLRPAEVACCVWAATKGGRRLEPAAVVAVQQHFIAAPGWYRSQELLQVMLAVGTSLAQQPQLQPQQQPVYLAGSNSSSNPSKSSWLAACCDRLQQLAPCMSAREVGTSLLALSRLGLRNAAPCTQHLPVPLSTRLLKRALDTLPSSCPRALTTMAYALAQLGLNPGPWWWASYLPYATAALHLSPPAELAVQAWSLAKLGVTPDQGYMQELLQHSGFKLQGFGAQELAMLLWALGRWRACPELWWWASFEHACQHMLSSFTAAELAALLCGMGSTGPPPSAPAATPAAAAAAALPGPAVALLMHAQQQEQRRELAVYRQTQQQQHYAVASRPCPPAVAPLAVDYIPSGSWAATVLVALQGALPGAPAGTLAGIIMGLARLDIHPSTAWRSRYETHVLEALPQGSMKEVAGLLWGYSVLAVQPGAALVQAVDQRLAVLLTQQLQGRGSASCSTRSGCSSRPHGGTAHSEAQDVQQSHEREAAGSQSAAAAGGSTTERLTQPLEWAALYMPRRQMQPFSTTTTTTEMVQPTRFSDTFPYSAAAAVTPDVAAQLLWSVATLPQPQGVAPWTDELLVAVMPQLQAGSSRTLLVMLRALAWLRHRPGHKGWLDAWWAAYAAAAAPAAAQAAASVACIGYGDALQPEQLFQGAAEQQQQQQEQEHAAAVLGSCPAANNVCMQLTVILWCFQQLRSKPTAAQDWLPIVAQQSLPLLPGLSGQRLCLLLNVLAELHVWLGQAWLAAAGSALLRRRSQLLERHVQQALADLHTLGWEA